MGMVLGLEEINHVKSLAGSGTRSTLVKSKLPSRNTGQGPSAGTWLALPDVILPSSFKLGSLPVARECIPKHSCLPAQALMGGLPNAHLSACFEDRRAYIAGQCLAQESRLLIQLLAAHGYLAVWLGMRKND